MSATYGELIDKVDGFDRLPQAEQVMYISYFYTIISANDEFTSGDISLVFKNESITRPSNITDCLNRLANKSSTVLIKKGTLYSFHRTAKKKLSETFLEKKHVRETSDILRTLLSKVTSPEQKAFLEEAITCYEVKANRAAIVMSWLLTMDILYVHTIKHKLADFNTAMSRNTKFRAWPSIAKKEDFSDMKENDFIDLLASASIITKEQKKLLVEKLGIRNTAAHPNIIEIREAKVISYIEDLVPNIISNFQ